MGCRLTDQGYRKALVTGSSTGIGRAISEAFIAEGLEVIGISRTPPADMPSGYHHISLDLLDEEKLQSALRTMRNDPPDIWVNNAGHGIVGDAWSTSSQQIERTQRLLYEVPVQLTRFFGEVCQKEKNSPKSLIQVSSLAVELPIPSMPYYNAAKSALSAFTQSLLLDGKLPFRLIDFRPGDFNTNFFHTEDIRKSRDIDGPVFRSLKNRHDKAPDPTKAANQLIKAMRRGRSGTIRSGTFFQSMIAPLGPRLLPQCLLRYLIRKNYE